jgi:hypothetical protein
VTSPWRRIDEAAEYLRFPSAKACWEWMKRHQVPLKKRGRVVLVHVDDLEACLTTAPARRDRRVS